MRSSGFKRRVIYVDGGIGRDSSASSKFFQSRAAAVGDVCGARHCTATPVSRSAAARKGRNRPRTTGDRIRWRHQRDRHGRGRATIAREIMTIRIHIGEIVVIGRQPGPELGPESRIVPSLRVKVRPYADDRLALPAVGGNGHAIAEDAGSVSASHSASKQRGTRSTCIVATTSL
jgi:hypothetical protein